MLRPLAEQLLKGLSASAPTVCDLICDSGMLTRELVARGVQRVQAVDVEPHYVAAVSDLPAVVPTVADSAEAIATAAGACDAVFSLLTSGFAEHLVVGALRLIDEAVTLRIVTWDPADPPAHEQALRDALLVEARHQSHFLEAVLALPELDLPVTQLRDVVRFDTVAHSWMALVTDRVLQTELASLPTELLRAVQERFGDNVRAFAAADGTLRIPVRALLHCSP